MIPIVCRRLRPLSFASAVVIRRGYATASVVDKNILSLSDRGFFQDLFPDNAG